jgi:hypothetical protein
MLRVIPDVVKPMLLFSNDFNEFGPNKQGIEII